MTYKANFKHSALTGNNRNAKEEDKINSPFHTELIFYNGLSEAQQNNLTEQLFAVYQTRLEGRNKTLFDEQFHDARANQTYVVIARENTKILGYLIYHRYNLEYPAKPTGPAKKTLQGNQYAIFKGQACIHPDIQHSNFLSYAVCKVLSYYHQQDSSANVLVYDSIINPKSYKIMHHLAEYAFPSPIYQPNQAAENFMQHLKQYFGFTGFAGSNYLIRSYSNVLKKERLAATDKITQFYIDATGLLPYVGMACMFCFYMRADNSLQLPAAQPWTGKNTAINFATPKESTKFTEEKAGMISMRSAKL